MHFTPRDMVVQSIVWEQLKGANNYTLRSRQRWRPLPSTAGLTGQRQPVAVSAVGEAEQAVRVSQSERASERTQDSHTLLSALHQLDNAAPVSVLQKAGGEGNHKGLTVCQPRRLPTSHQAAAAGALCGKQGWASQGHARAHTAGPVLGLAAAATKQQAQNKQRYTIQGPRGTWRTMARSEKHICKLINRFAWKDAECCNASGHLSGRGDTRSNLHNTKQPNNTARTDGWALQFQCEWTNPSTARLVNDLSQSLCLC